jgi:hypothetical protein
MVLRGSDKTAPRDMEPLRGVVSMDSSTALGMTHHLPSLLWPSCYLEKQTQILPPGAQSIQSHNG